MGFGRKLMRDVKMLVNVTKVGLNQVEIFAKAFGKVL